MASKKETLKFTRIQARAEYSTGNIDTNAIKGYLNTFNEFKKWDVERTQSFSTIGYNSQNIEDGITSDEDSPYRIFEKEFKSEYDAGTLSFVIENIFIPYDRRIHNLKDLAGSGRIWVYTANGLLINLLTAGISTYSQALATAPTLVFRINPTKIDVDKKKLFKKIRTRAGFVFQHWGPDIGIINFSGTTGSLIPNTAFNIQTKKILGVQVPVFVSIVDEKPTELNSPALKAFRELESWYDNDQSEDWVKKGYLTALEYRGRTYVVHFANFKFNETGEQPYQFYYSVSFQVHYDSGHLQNAVTRASNQIVRNQESIDAIRALKQIKGKGLHQ